MRLDFIHNTNLYILMKPNTLERYYVLGADWDALVDSSGTSEAAVSVFEDQYAKDGKNVKLSPTMTVVNLSVLIKDLDCQGTVDILSTPTVLADAGLHALSKKFRDIILDD